MKVAWITEEPPDRSGSGGGGGIRQAHLLLALAARHEVHLVLSGRLRDQGVGDAVASVREVEAGAVAPSLAAVALGRATFETSVAREQRGALAAVIPAADVVLLHHHALAPLLARRRAGERWLLHQFHVPTVEAEAVASSWLGRRNARTTARLQRWIASQADAIVAVSDADASRLGGRTVVVPNGADPDLAASPVPEARRVAVTGSLDFPPNVDGVRWLVAEVWPRVRAEVPDAILELAGRRPVDEVRTLEGPGVTVHADVADALEHVRRARVVAVPVRFGSGTRIKVLEALAAGRPIVSTSNGVAGLAAAPVIVADAPGAFAAAVVGLLTDRDRATALGRAGPAAAPRWPVIGARFAEWLERS